MTIIAESRSSSAGASATVRRQEEPDPGSREERALRALVRAGMSRQTALEQISRLAAGDIWSG
jgi:hypothetical protein